MKYLFSSLLFSLLVSQSLLAASISTASVADAFVATGPTGNLTNNNYGGGGALAIAAPGLTNGEFQTVMKFDFSILKTTLDTDFGLGLWSVQSVSLQLTSSPHNNAIYNDVVAGSFAISLMQNSSWIEGTGTASSPTSNGISYSTLLNSYINVPSDQPLGNFSFPGGTVGTNKYLLPSSSNLNADILSGSLASLRLYAADNQISYLFSSRSGGVAAQPELIVTALAVPEPGLIGLVVLGGMLILRIRAHLPRTTRPVVLMPVNTGRN